MTFLHLTVNSNLGIFSGNANSAAMLLSDCKEAWEALNDNLENITYLILTDSQTGDLIRVPGGVIKDSIITVSFRSQF